MSPGPLADIPVLDTERLARFILNRRHIRNLDGQIFLRAEAFAPYRHMEMSATRHRDLTEAGIWALGAEAAQQRERHEGREFPLVGRADFGASDAREQHLDVVPDEPPRNHANVTGWPPDKPAQMIRALELSSKSAFVTGPG